jgi:hypothetical protein
MKKKKVSEERKGGAGATSSSHTLWDINKIKDLIDVAKYQSSEDIEDLVSRMRPEEIQAAFVELAEEQSEGAPDGTPYGDLASTAMRDLMPYMSIADICSVSKAAAPEALTEMIRVFGDIDDSSIE